MAAEGALVISLDQLLTGKSDKSLALHIQREAVELEGCQNVL